MLKWQNIKPTHFTSLRFRKETTRSEPPDHTILIEIKYKVDLLKFNLEFVQINRKIFLNFSLFVLVLPKKPHIF